MDALINPPKEWGNERKMTEFMSNLNSDLMHSEQLSIDKIDLFFFPLVKGKHFYLTCIDVRTGNSVVIDSMNDSQSECNLNKHDNIPQNLISFLIEFMKKRNLYSKATLLEKGRVCMPPIKWEDQNNTVNTCVYLIRHMETYMGDIPSWKSGLSTSTKRLLKTLRVRYCASLILSDKNVLKNEMAAQSDSYYKKLDGKTKHNLERMLTS